MMPGMDGYETCRRFKADDALKTIPIVFISAATDTDVKVRAFTSGGVAMAMTRRLHREFGLLVGTSSGANLIAALQLARELGPRATVVTMLCDRAERYFSTPLFDSPEK